MRMLNVSGLDYKYTMKVNENLTLDNVKAAI